MNTNEKELRNKLSAQKRARTMAAKRRAMEMTMKKDAMTHEIDTLNLSFCLSEKGRRFAIWSAIEWLKREGLGPKEIYERFEGKEWK